MADIGKIALILGLLVCIYSVIASLVGQKRGDPKLIDSARNGVFAVFGLVTIAAISLIYALVTHDFQIEYVAQYTSRDMSLPYLISALWAGNSGSLLTWAWLLSIFAPIIVLWNKDSGRQLIPYVTSVVLATTAFFLVLLIFVVSPFDKLAFVPPDGNGLNPMLQNIGMILHPPTLLAGFAALTLPFGLAIAAMTSQRTGREWLVDLRRWVLIAWVFLSIGNVLGAWWAYVELGWGGYWAWDPVENSSLMPWIVATALLHSIIIQKTRGRHRLWSIALTIIAFNLCILATFLTRTGVLESVHAFGESSMGPLFLAFIGVGVIGPLVLLYKRRHLFETEQEPGPVLSKEGSFQAGNILFIVATTIILIGTLSPLIRELFGGEKTALGETFFNVAVGPFFLMIILLMGICVLIGWQRSALQTSLPRFILPLVISLALCVGLAAATEAPIWAVVAFSIAGFLVCTILVELYRTVMVRSRAKGVNPLMALGESLLSHRPRWAAMTVHLGIAFIAIGVIGSSALEVEKDVVLEPTESTTINHYTLTYESIQGRNTPSMDVVTATLSVYNGEHFAGQLIPEKYFHRSYDQPVTEVAIRSTLREDLYVALAGWEEDGTAAFEIKVMPAVKWIWIGGGLLFFGGLLALWTQKKTASRETESIP